jgi:hypothetical protein
MFCPDGLELSLFVIRSALLAYYEGTYYY